jgi:peroxiredoxin
MRIHIYRRALSLAGLIIATAWLGLLPLPAAPAEDISTGSSSDLLYPKLRAKDADAAWIELNNSSRQPPTPQRWHLTPPSLQEQQDFFMPYILALAGKANDFYTRFPRDPNAIKAKLLEFKFLTMTVKWGETSQQAHLEVVEKSLLSDPTVPTPDHFGIMWLIALNSPPDKALPLLREITNGAAPDKIKEAAAGQIKIMEAVGKPVEMQFTAVDGRSVDLAKLKGKVVLIDFWASWCTPAVGQVEDIRSAYDQFHPKGFEIVGISLDKDKDALTQFTGEHKMAWPEFFDGLYWQNKYARQFGIQSIPDLWLIDKKGLLRNIDAWNHLDGDVQKLLAE